MAQLLRQIVAGPRLPNTETGLDLCYVTDNIIVTSGPSSTYPKRAYRNPTDALVKFFDSKHDSNWAIWEFRAEGTGYPDSEVHGRVHHFPWPDHHPPPFALIPNIIASMRNWLKDPENGKGRVVVVHCKAGKGRSGTVACSYLISEEGWTMEEALNRFTARRMRQGFGAGVSIPSQLRWVGYVDKWARSGKVYMERQVEILEVHIWGLREGVKVAIEGFVDEGKTIKIFHVFKKSERLIVDTNSPKSAELNASVPSSAPEPSSSTPTSISEKLARSSTPQSRSPSDAEPGHEPGGPAVIFRPSTRIILPSNDINVDFERRNRARYGWTLVTAVAHVWFNAYFEALADEASDYENGGSSKKSGVFEIEWDAMDGIKGSLRKGTRALDRMAIVWKAIDTQATTVRLPKLGEAVPETQPADWEQGTKPFEGNTKDLGLRVENPSSASVSKASSLRSGAGPDKEREEEREAEDDDSLKGVQSRTEPGEEDTGILQDQCTRDGTEPITKHVSTMSLQEGKPEEDMETSK
ncbi:MAG: Telomerase protein component 1 [Icmadophila ericetorum]|nr:Telomerase protein component 1 [Icmadophila ericetorum]